jgi:hypothetical protein
VATLTTEVLLTEILVAIAAEAIIEVLMMAVRVAAEEATVADHEVVATIVEEVPAEDLEVAVVDDEYLNDFIYILTINIQQNEEKNNFSTISRIEQFEHYGSKRI